LDEVKTYIDIWNDRLLKNGDLPFLITAGKTMSYKEVWERTAAIANRLRELGIRENMLVALKSEQDEQAVQIILSLLYIGAVAAPINHHFSDKQIAGVLKENPFQFLLNDGDVSLSSAKMKIVSFDEIFNGKEINHTYKYVKRGVNKAATIIFSSGSTSQPKAVVHNFANHFFSALGSNKNISFSKGDVWLLSLPLYHIAGMSVLFRALLSASAVRIVDKKESIVDLLGDHKVTHVSLVEAQLVTLLAHKSLNNRMAKLKAILVGGSAISSHLIADAIKLGWNIYTTYGSTEMCSQVTTTSSAILPKELNSSGRLLDYRALKIGEQGEILLKGKTLSCGYLQQGKLFDIRDGDGWFHSTDLGELDRQGLLYVKGRLDNMFISGGENIYPEYIEGVIKKLAKVEDALIVPVKDKRFGFCSALFIKMQGGYIPSLEELKQMLSGKIVSFMVPNYIFPWLAEVESGMIKINREKFKKKAQQLINSHGEDIENR
jgi:O-succinylbenzoic acid--CoA ligase